MADRAAAIPIEAADAVDSGAPADGTDAEVSPPCVNGPTNPKCRQRTIAVDKLTEHPGNVREDLGLTAEFCASIAENGVRVPLLITTDGGSGFRVIEGHRNFSPLEEATALFAAHRLATTSGLPDPATSIWPTVPPRLRSGSLMIRLLTGEAALAVLVLAGGAACGGLNGPLLSGQQHPRVAGAPPRRRGVISRRFVIFGTMGRPVPGVDHPARGTVVVTHGRHRVLIIRQAAPAPLWPASRWALTTYTVGSPLLMTVSDNGTEREDEVTLAHPVIVLAGTPQRSFSGPSSCDRPQAARRRLRKISRYTPGTMPIRGCERPRRVGDIPRKGHRSPRNTLQFALPSVDTRYPPDMGAGPG